MFASSQFRIWCTVWSIINFLKSISSPNVPFMTEDLLGQNPLKRLDLKVNAFSMLSVAQPSLCVVWPVGRQRIRRNKKTTWPVWDCILPPKPQIPPTLFVNLTWFQILIGLHYSRTAFRQTINFIPIGHMISLQPTVQLIFSYRPEWEIYLFCFNLLYPVHSVL